MEFLHKNGRRFQINAVTNALALAFDAGEQTIDECVRRGAQVLALEPDWLAPIAQHYLNAFTGRTRARHREIVRVVRTALHDRLADLAEFHSDNSPAYHAALQRAHEETQVYSWLIDAPVMQPVPGAFAWNVPVIESTVALAEWLHVSSDELQWFEARRTQNGTPPERPFHHYHYRLTPKSSGAFRLIEAPQSRLKDIQHRILYDILERVPNYYSAAHGFVKGRSVRTFAAPHVGKQVVVRMDLRDFFPTISRARVGGIFRTLGYPEAVANALAAVCTNVTPRSVFDAIVRTESNVRTIFEAKQLFARPHLPQGAPTSPALANICAYRMDCRLTALADWAGATYTRYADDLAFSGDGDVARFAERYSTGIAVIAAAEGWSVHHRKTRIMRQGVRQHLTGVVVNRILNVPRCDFDALKAVLTNCVRHGAQNENREAHPDFRAHLAGRIAWVASLNPKRGARLRALFEQVNWQPTAS